MNTQYLRTSQGTLSFDDTGTGPLVICIPSMGDVRAEYRFLAPQLVAAGYRVVTMDMRGLGETSVNWPDYSVAAIGSDILALIRHLQAGPALLIATSMAAGASVWADAEAPDLIAGMVLIGPFVRDLAPLWRVRVLYTLLFALPWGVMVWNNYYATLYPTAKPADFNEYQAALRANLRQPGRLSALYHMLMTSKAASAARLSKVTAPVMVIMGTKDPDFSRPEQEAHFVTQQLHGETRMIEGAGHYPHAEMPDKTLPLITAFFDNIKVK